VQTRVVPAWDRLDVTSALEATMHISSLANQYVDRAAPWTAAKKGDTERVEHILATLLEVLRWLSVLLWPVMPKKSDEMRVQLGLPPIVPAVGTDLWPPLGGAHEPGPLHAGTPLFPTYDADQTKALLEKLVPKIETTAESPAAAPAPATEPKTVTYDQFAAIDLRVGIVRTAEKVPKKDKLLRLSIDLGEHAPRQIVAGLARTFTPEALVGRRVVVVANLAPRDFGKGLVSQGMLLATGPEDALELATVAGEAKPGMRLK
jgi:methionyl-tRNA synthetase